MKVTDPIAFLLTSSVLRRLSILLFPAKLFCVNAVGAENKTAKARTPDRTIFLIMPYIEIFEKFYCFDEKWVGKLLFF
jgi:hypothetical protein